MRPRLSRKRGQAAVETAFSIPVLAILFLIGFQLYAITWTAQAVHVRARYQAMATIDHNTCYYTGGGRRGQEMARGPRVYGRDTRVVATDRGILSGIRASQYSLTQEAYAVCYMRAP